MFLHIDERTVFWVWSFLPVFWKCFSFWYLWTSYQCWCFYWINCSMFVQLFNCSIFCSIVQLSNLYSQQSRRNFLTNAMEMKTLIGVNYTMALNQLPIISIYCDCIHFVGNVGIQNMFRKTRYQEVTKPSLCQQGKTRQNR